MVSDSSLMYSRPSSDFSFRQPTGRPRFFVSCAFLMIYMYTEKIWIASRISLARRYYMVYIYCMIDDTIIPPGGEPGATDKGE